MPKPTPPETSLTTILLDLDNTLVCNDARRFVATYLARLVEAQAAFGPAEKLTALVLQAAEAIQTNRNPALTNAQVFYGTLLPALDGDAGDFKSGLARFYRTLYPALEALVTPKSEAPALIETLFSQGYKVIIATNPLFERPAIDQRLAWAGVADHPYHLVTTMENMHFCKPHLEYYREILAQVDSTPAESLMVGDDPDNDIIPAGRIGMRTWFITTPPSPRHPVATYQGSLADFHRWIRDKVSDEP